jgi:TrkA domain protein
MPTELRETRLPGIGVKYGFRLAAGGRVSLILHNDGKRELYWFRRASDEEPTAVMTLDDDEARQIGAVLGGAYQRPKIVEELEMALGELTIEWDAVPDTSPLIGKTLAEAGLRAKSVSGAQPNDFIQQGDTLVSVGKAGQYPAFHRMLETGEAG